MKRLVIRFKKKPLIYIKINKKQFHFKILTFFKTRKLAVQEQRDRLVETLTLLLKVVSGDSKISDCPTVTVRT